MTDETPAITAEMAREADDRMPILGAALMKHRHTRVRNEIREQNVRTALELVASSLGFTLVRKE